MAIFITRPLTPADNRPVRQLILAGLGERFGQVDETLNPDCDNLYQFYVEAGQTFLVLEEDGHIIGCGALMAEPGRENVGRLVRVSVASSHQGRGYGRIISQELMQKGVERGFTQLLVETNADWHSALQLYRALGFEEYGRTVDPHFGYIEVHLQRSFL